MLRSPSSKWIWNQVRPHVKRTGFTAAAVFILSFFVAGFWEATLICLILLLVQTAQDVYAISRGEE